MKWTEDHAVAVLCHWLLRERRMRLVVPNVHFLDVWESDVLALDNNLSAHEFEIKVSLADFKRELVDKKEKHKELARGKLPLLHFYFVAPVAMLSPELLPPYAGLIELDHDPSRFDLLRFCTDVRVTKKPTIINKTKAKPHQIDQLHRALQWKVVNHRSQASRDLMGGRFDKG